MKKIAAFITAAMLFIIAAAAVHQFAGSRIEANNREFGTWINSKKDLSYSAIAANLHEDTFMMLGFFGVPARRKDSVSSDGDIQAGQAGRDVHRSGRQSMLFSCP